MEPDVLPVQQWLAGAHDGRGVATTWRCQKLVAEGQQPALRQSWYGEIRDRRDYHHNGNALYCLWVARASQHFRQSRASTSTPAAPCRRVMKAGGCATGAPPTSWAWTTPCSSSACAKTPSTTPSTVMAKFQYTDFLQNHCQEPYDPDGGGEAGAGHVPRAQLSASFRHPSHVTWSDRWSSTAAFERSARRTTSASEVRRRAWTWARSAGEEELIKLHLRGPAAVFNDGTCVATSAAACTNDGVSRGAGGPSTRQRSEGGADRRAALQSLA